MKPVRRRQTPSWVLTLAFLAYALLLMLLLAISRPSDASETDKKVSEGYYGPERFKVTEEPVRPNSEVSTQKGWIGDKRIDLKVIRTNEYTITRGWVGDEYIRKVEPAQEEERKE